MGWEVPLKKEKVGCSGRKEVPLVLGGEMWYSFVVEKMRLRR